MTFLYPHVCFYNNIATMIASCSQVTEAYCKCVHVTKKSNAEFWNFVPILKAGMATADFYGVKQHMQHLDRPFSLLISVSLCLLNK